MQKIKYPVGSKIGNSSWTIIIIDVSKNEYLALTKQEYNGRTITCFTQEELDDLGYKLVSSPRWVPDEENENYFFINSLGIAEENSFHGKEFFEFRLKCNNVFQTRQECQKKIDEINSREI